MDLRLVAPQPPARPAPAGVPPEEVVALAADGPDVCRRWAAAAGAQGAHDLLVAAIRAPRAPSAAAAFEVLAAMPGPAVPLVRALVEHPVLGLRAQAWLQRVGAEPLPSPEGLWPEELLVLLAAAAWRHGGVAAGAVLEQLGRPSARAAAVVAVAGVDDPLVDEVLPVLERHGGARVARAAREQLARRSAPSPFGPAAA